MKTKLLLIAWLCLYAMQALAAFTPSGTKVYTIKNIGTSSYAAYNSAAVSGSNNILTAVSSVNAFSFFIVEAADEDGYFTIRVAGPERYYVYAINRNNEDSNVGVKQLAADDTVGDDCKWTLTESTTGYYNIKPKGGANGWNKRGTVNGVSAIGQWNQNNNDNNKWLLEEVTSSQLGALKPASAACTTGDNIGNVNTAYTTLFNNIAPAWTSYNEATTKTTELVTAYCYALQTYVEAPPRYINLPSGYYYIHCAQTSGSNNPFGAYWFDDPYNVLGNWTNPNGYTLGMVPTDEQKVKNNFIWKVTRGELPNKVVGIVNGTGSNVKGNSINATSTLTLGLSDTYANGTVYFTQGTHISNQAHYTLGNTTNANAAATRSNPFFLTKWSDSNSTGSQVIFEEVTGKDFYTVTAPTSVMSGIPSEGMRPIYITYTATGEKAANGGFFAVPTGTTLQPSDFTAPVVNGKEYTFAIDAANKTLTLTYNENSSAAVISKAEYLLAKGGKVGYPTTSTTVYTNLQTVLNAAKTAGESVTDAQVTAVNEAITAFVNYGSVSGETSFAYPEVGKAYTFTFRDPNGKKYYMNYETGGYTAVETDAPNNSGYPDEAIMVCVEVTADGKYIFKNFARKYLCWKGKDAGPNGNKGFMEEYNASYTWFKMTKLTTLNTNSSKYTIDRTQPSMLGAMAVQGKRENNNDTYFIYSYTSNPKIFNQENAIYHSNAHTSVIYIEEVEKYDVYLMGSVTGNTSLLIGEMMPEEVTLTRSATNESETQTYGFFISQHGEEPEASEFSAPVKGYKEATITVDGTNKVVNVAYALTTDWEELRALANKLLSTERVGYPAINSSLRTRLSEAVASSNVETLQTAIDNYMSTTEEDIILPKDGQAYTMTAATKDGKKFYMKYTAEGYTMVETTESDNTNYPEEAILICRDLGNGRYAFQNTARKYMCWKGTDTSSGAYNSNKGFSDTYSAANTWIGVEKIVVGKRYNGTAASNVDGSQSNLFGAVAVKGYRNDADNNNIAYYVINQTSGAYNRTAAPYYKSGYTSAILIEPVATVTYNPQPPMNNSEGAISEKIKKVATYSAPIATVVPSNVKAYYVSASEGAGGQATLVAWPDTDGQQVLPDNTGVILTSTDADATLAALTPATSETVNELPSGSTNLLQNTAAGPHTFAANEGFILAKGTYGVGLYKAKAGSTLARNKAYLDYSNPSQSASTAVRMVIGGNTPTDITHLMPQEDVDEQAPIYDLSGRRVQHTVKGGLYIRNGRKFIVR